MLRQALIYYKSLKREMGESLGFILMYLNVNILVQILKWRVLHDLDFGKYLIRIARLAILENYISNFVRFPTAILKNE
jgi:hypothetical protein